MEVAIVVNSIKTNNQLSYLLTKESKKNDIIVFSQNEYTINTNNGFSICMSYDFWNYKGKNVIATDIDSCKLILKNPSIKNFFFYIWDLEWLRLKSFDYEDLNYIYNNNKINLVARSERHSLAVQHAWNKKCSVVEDLDVKKIIRSHDNEPINA